MEGTWKETRGDVHVPYVVTSKQSVPAEIIRTFLTSSHFTSHGLADKRYNMKIYSLKSYMSYSSGIPNSRIHSPIRIVIIQKIRSIPRPHPHFPSNHHLHDPVPRYLVLHQSLKSGLATNSLTPLIVIVLSSTLPLLLNSSLVCLSCN